MRFSGSIILDTRAAIWLVGGQPMSVESRLTPDVWFSALLSLPGLRLSPLPPNVLIASAFLPGSPPKDPADRIIAITGRTYGFTIITRDGELLLYAKAGHIAAIRC